MLFAASGAALLGNPAFAAGALEVRNGTAAGGGGIVSAGRFRVVWTIGEAAMGTTEAAGLRITSGFPATIVESDIQGAPSDGDIFKDGFEDTVGASP